MLAGLREDLVYLDEWVATLEQTIQTLANSHADARRLLKLRGVGPITATALVASLGDGDLFQRGRDASAWVGLVPGQHSIGDTAKRRGISERGDVYLRTLLVHGARSAILTAKGMEYSLSRWAQKLCTRSNKNIVAVALTAKPITATRQRRKPPDSDQPRKFRRKQAPERSNILHDCHAPIIDGKQGKSASAKP